MGLFLHFLRSPRLFLHGSIPSSFDRLPTGGSAIRTKERWSLSDFLCRIWKELEQAKISLPDGMGEGQGPMGGREGGGAGGLFNKESKEGAAKEIGAGPPPPVVHNRGSQSSPERRSRSRFMIDLPSDERERGKWKRRRTGWPGEKRSRTKNMLARRCCTGCNKCRTRESVDETQIKKA